MKPLRTTELIQELYPYAFYDWEDNDRNNTLKFGMPKELLIKLGEPNYINRGATNQLIILSQIHHTLMNNG